MIRTTQPEIYIGSTPSLAAGHGNHQQAGRLIWEGVLAAADPTKFPEQLRGPHALSIWPFQATVRLKSGAGSPTPGTVGLTVPPGWTSDGPKAVGWISDRQETTVTFTVTPSADATVNQNAKISARYTTGNKAGYTDNVVRVVSPVEGRFQRWGNWQEYDE